MRALPQAARRCLVGVWCAALILVLASLVIYPLASLSLSNLAVAFVFAALLYGADLLTLRLAQDRSISLALAPLIASLSAVGWPFAPAIVIVGTVSAALLQTAPWWRTLYNVALRLIMVTLLAGIAQLVYIDGQPPYTTLPALLGLAAMGVLAYVVEQGLATLLRACLATGEAESAQPLAPVTLRANWSGHGQNPLWYLLAVAPLGGLLGLLWHTSIWAFILGAAPAAVAQYAARVQVELRRRGDAFERLAAQSDEQARQLAGLQSLATTLIAIRDMQELPHTLCDRLAALLRAPGGWVVLNDQEQEPTGARMVLVARTGAAAGGAQGLRPAEPEPLLAQVAQSYAAVFARQRVVLFTDQHVQALTPAGQAPLWQALIVIPLLIEQGSRNWETIGAICLAFEHQRGLSVDEQRLLSSFGRQAALAVENARLFRRLRESQAELIQSSKLAAVGTFAAGIAHEFNNLLAGMIGYAQLGLSSDQVDEKNESLQVVVDACRRGKSVTGSLLTFARRQEPRREAADIGEAVAGTLTLMEIELRKSAITVERRIEAVPPTVCDLGQISQVFLNLLTNARDAMRPDGGRLLVELSAREGGIILAVEDTGCGIPDEIRDKIFEPFVTTKGALGGSQTPGTGLGLSVSYGIVQEHGGVIEITSAPGRGTRVSVRLPIIAPAIRDSEHAPVEAEPLPALRLLLVDDDDRVRGALSRLLEHAGHRVSVASDGVAALQCYHEQTFDLVLTDLTMPGTDGLTLVRQLRALDADATVLVFTGHALTDQIERAQEAGAAGVLHKPFELDEFQAAVARAWSSRLAAQAERAVGVR